eukprot:14068066-Ditylum_brightwellii.AAC.1
MGFSCSSAAMLLLCGDEYGGGVDVFKIAVLLILEKKKEEDASRVHSWEKKLFLKGLVWEEKVKRRKYLHCPLLLPVTLSSWRKMLLSGKETALITMT